MSINENALREQGAIETTNYKTHSFDYTKNKAFPAYGKQLNELRLKGLVPVMRVIVSTDWKLGKIYPRIVVTPESNPEKLNFSFLSGLSVQIVHHYDEADLVSCLIDEIMQVKPKILTVFNFDLAKNSASGYPAMTLIYPESVEAIYGT